jgi:hypothetical protein
LDVEFRFPSTRGKLRQPHSGSELPLSTVRPFLAGGLVLHSLLSSRPRIFAIQLHRYAEGAVGER